MGARSILSVIWPFLFGSIREIQLSEFQQTHSETAAIVELQPTQVTVGMREVELKRRSWRARDCDDAARYLSTHGVPVILGPGARLFIADGHHRTRALYDEGVVNVPICVVANVSDLSNDEFWRFLSNRCWVHPFDANGKRCPYEALPKMVGEIVDDPYRSLAGALRRAGGYAKNRLPFSEFRWANYLRMRIGRQIVDSDFSGALALAMNLALSREAEALPGWRPLPTAEFSGTSNYAAGTAGADRACRL